MAFADAGGTAAKSPTTTKTEKCVKHDARKAKKLAEQVQRLTALGKNEQAARKKAKGFKSCADRMAAKAAGKSAEKSAGKSTQKPVAKAAQAAKAAKANTAKAGRAKADR